ncbi:MAG: hypothetical protein ABW168_22260 [Sedimenticola sp.]
MTESAGFNVNDYMCDGIRYNYGRKTCILETSIDYAHTIVK